VPEGLPSTHLLSTQVQLGLSFVTFEAQSYLSTHSGPQAGTRRKTGTAISAAAATFKAALAMDRDILSSRDEASRIRVRL
jgi:hypothetical protein